MTIYSIVKSFFIVKRIARRMFVTIQSRILAIVASITIVSSFILSINLNGAAAIVTFVIGIFGMIIAVFDQDCTVIGNCRTWSWIKLAISCIILLTPLIVTVYNINNNIDVKKQIEKGDDLARLDVRYTAALMP